MLKSLYDYAVDRELVLPPGYVSKTIAYFINLASDGTYLGLIPGGDEPFLYPDIGSLANGKDKCNVLVEKRSVILDTSDSPKSHFFRAALADGGESEPDLRLCLTALENPDTFAAISTDADRNKVKPGDRISFAVGGNFVIKSENVRKWWQGFRLQFQKSAKSYDLPLCLITGEPTIPMETVPPVTGLLSVGGHGKGDALICFDKNAFQSYGLKKSANAPVSEEAFYTVKAGLDDLLKRAPILAGMKFVHWYDKPIPREKDPVVIALGWGISDDEPEDESEVPLTEREIRAEETKATNLVKSVTDGNTPPPLASRYTILLLSGVTGRVMVRRYENGSYEALREKLELWDDDLRLCKANGTQLLAPYKLTARLTRLLPRRKNDSKIFDRLRDELPGLTPTVITAITSGAPLPDAIAVRALAYIRSRLLETDDEAVSLPIPDPIACQWLKAWLCRKHRTEHKEEALMEYYNPAHPEKAYHCGSLMCIYANIQNFVMPNVNANVIQRYYASAIQTPALVLGTLSRQSTHHQEKIQSVTWRNYFGELLCTAHSAVGDSIPTTLTLEQQSLFALGYYQMQAEINMHRFEKKDSEE